MHILFRDPEKLTHFLGYKEFDTGRTYMCRMGDWRDNKDEEIELDGIGGVNIIVKADVNKSGKGEIFPCLIMMLTKGRHQLSMLRI